MDDFKEFQGSDLDNAIKQACSYYNATREKLEIDIIQDSKSGIFGLVGARKAKVKARKVQLRAKVDDILGNDKKNDERASRKADLKNNERSANSKDDSIQSKVADSSKNTNVKKPKLDATKNLSSSSNINSNMVDVPSSINDEDEIASYGPGNELAKSSSLQNNRRNSNNGNPRAKNSTNVRDFTSIKNTKKPIFEKNVKSIASENTADVLGDDVINEELVLIPFEELDHEALKSICFDTVRILTAPIVGEVPIYVEILEGRVNVSLDCGDDSGLLIGREGQTLASIQYLTSRVVSRKMQAGIRIQLDAGEYRLRQDEKLKSIALALAERVKSSGRSYSTRPLSSYHRRIVHLALQESLEVQTRSSGEGTLKRVIVQRKRG